MIETDLDNATTGIIQHLLELVPHLKSYITLLWLAASKALKRKWSGEICVVQFPIAFGKEVSDCQFREERLLTHVPCPFPVANTLFQP